MCHLLYVFLFIKKPSKWFTYHTSVKIIYVDKRRKKFCFLVSSENLLYYYTVCRIVCAVHCPYIHTVKKVLKAKVFSYLKIFFFITDLYFFLINMECWYICMQINYVYTNFLLRKERVCVWVSIYIDFTTERIGDIETNVRHWFESSVPYF